MSNQDWAAIAVSLPVLVWCFVAIWRSFSSNKKWPF